MPKSNTTVLHLNDLCVTFKQVKFGDFIIFAEYFVPKFDDYYNLFYLFLIIYPR